MKKFLSILTLLCLAVTGTWAELLSPYTITFDNSTNKTNTNSLIGGSVTVNEATWNLTLTGTNSDKASTASNGMKLGDSNNSDIAAKFSSTSFASYLIKKVSVTWKNNTKANSGKQMATTVTVKIGGENLAAANENRNNSSAYTHEFSHETGLTGSNLTIEFEQTGEYINPYYVQSITVTFEAVSIGAVDPEFSLTKASIGTDETSQIQVGSKGNLDGISLSNISYSTSGIVTVDASGVVTPTTTGTTTITFDSGEVTDSYNASTGNSVTITVTAPVVATPSITAGGVFTESKTVEISCSDDEATIKYSYDNETWATYTEALTITATTTVYAKAVKDGCTDSEVVSATYTKFAKSDIAAINGSKTWTIPTSISLQLSGTTTPEKSSTDFYTYADIATLNSNDLGTFDGTTLGFRGEYPYRGSNGSQNGWWKFVTTVPGDLTIEFSNTGGSNKDRYVKVNGITGTVEADGTTHRTEIFTVGAGDVIITGVNGSTSAEGTEKDAAIRVYSITFTAKTSTTVTVGDKLYRTFASKYPLTFPVEGLTAYKANVTGDNVTFEEVTGKVPAGEGLLLKATAADTYTISVPAGEVATIDNALVGVTKETTIDGAGIFVLYADDTHPIGFYKTEATSFTVGANTAYLPANTSARTFIALDGETTGIGATLMNSEKVNSEVYNLNGQRVMNPAKGLYIVNGRKVVIK